MSENNKEEGENRGASIKPSARPSIHRRNNYPLSQADNIMVRYGLNTRRPNKANTSHASEGIDEVDNVFSKLSSSHSDRQIIHREKRRNSINTPSLHDVQASDENDTDSEDDSLNVLSKSLPAILPSHPSPYRNASGQWQNELQKSSGSVKSFRPSQINESANSFNNSFDSQRTLHVSQNQSNKLFVIIIPMIVIALGIILYPDRSVFYVPGNTMSYCENNFFKDMNNLGAKYRISEDSILRVKSGISSVSEKRDTSSFIFAYDSQSDKFDYNLFNMFIEEIAYTTAQYLRNDSTPVNHLSLDGSKLEMKTHGELVTKYRDEVTKTGVMLVKDIDKVPATLAMAFHYYCDEYDPLARKSAIFFTLNMAQCYSNTGQKSTHSNIEKCLAKKWSAVPQDNIGPLLTRVVNIIVDVTNVF